jgi:hypothetical protein
VINRKEACDHSVPRRLEPHFTPPPSHPPFTPRCAAALRTPLHTIPSHHPLRGDLGDGSCCRTS